MKVTFSSSPEPIALAEAAHTCSEEMEIEGNAIHFVSSQNYTQTLHIDQHNICLEYAASDEIVLS